MSKMECPYLEDRCPYGQRNDEVRRLVCTTEFFSECEGYKGEIIPRADLTSRDFSNLIAKIKDSNLVVVTGGQE